MLHYSSPKTLTSLELRIKRELLFFEHYSCCKKLRNTEIGTNILVNIFNS